jgi:hypothetical protein
MSHYSATQTATEEASAHRPLSQITIGELYTFLMKLMVAGFLATAPIALVIWLINYAATH